MRAIMAAASQVAAGRQRVQRRSTGGMKFLHAPAGAPNVPPMPHTRQIVAFGGGGFSMEAGNPLLDDYVLELAAAAACERPKVCFMPTASGDADHYIVRFYRHFPASRCEPSHVSLFRRDCGTDDVRAHLLGQDLIYVGGGSVVCLMGVLRAHGLDVALREAWEAGVVLCGLSAGSLCWFEEAMTGYHGNSRPVQGIGLLAGSNSVHYDKEAHRRPAYHLAIAGGMPGGYAVEDGAALHFEGDSLARVVSSRPAARAYRVESVGDEVVEVPLPVDYLGAGSGVEPALAA
jgi:peptidase E